MMGNWYNTNAYNWMTRPGFGLGLSFLLLWGIFWKGMALWRAAKENSTYWFVALLVFQTWGVLEIVYLLIFAKSKLTFSSTTKKPLKKSKKS